MCDQIRLVSTRREGQSVVKDVFSSQQPESISLPLFETAAELNTTLMEQTCEDPSPLMTEALVTRLDYSTASESVVDFDEESDNC